LDVIGYSESNQNRPQVNKNLKQMITMDGVLHKIPYGQKNLPEYSKFSTHLNLFRSVSVNYDRGHSHQVMKRSRSLSDSVGQYSQLLESLSRESSQKTTQSGTRVVANQSFKESTMASGASQGDDSSLSALESMPSGTKLSKDGLFEKQDSTVFSLQVTDSILSPSETVVDDMTLTKEDYFRQSVDATDALLNGVESISSTFVQDVVKRVGSGIQTLESSEEFEKMTLVQEEEEFSAVQDDASPHVSNYEMLEESSVSVLDSEFFDDPITAKVQNLEG
jgi:hypothetical protein